MDSTTQIPWAWWIILVVINSLNFLGMIYIYWKSSRDNESIYKSYKRKMRILGLIYVSVALYRSVFVSGYLDQLAWFNTIANSSLLIRCFAIFSEISFAGLIMLSLLQLNREVPALGGWSKSNFIKFFETKAPYVFFGCIFFAQFFATSATITKLVTLFAIEETLWGIAFLFITPSILIQAKKVFSYKSKEDKEQYKMFRIFTVFLALFCIGYGGYSVFYHLPLEYWPYALEQFAGETSVPEIRTGIEAVKDAFVNVNQTRDYDTWGGIGFMIWYTGYFTLCVWMVLFFASAPRKLMKKTN